VCDTGSRNKEELAERYPEAVEWLDAVDFDGKVRAVLEECSDVEHWVDFASTPERTLQKAEKSLHSRHDFWPVHCQAMAQINIDRLLTFEEYAATMGLFQLGAKN